MPSNPTLQSHLSIGIEVAMGCRKGEVQTYE
jgi:hypothetical protein